MTAFVVAAHGIIRNEDKILATRRSATNDYKPGVWDFPGGKVEAGETPEAGLRREIKEETGLDVNVGRIDHVFANLTELPQMQYFLLLYECVFKGGDIILNPEEHDEYRWVTIEELRQMPTIHLIESWINQQK